MPQGSVEWPCRPPTQSKPAPTHLLPHLHPHPSLAPPPALPPLPAQNPKSATQALSAQPVSCNLVSSSQHTSPFKQERSCKCSASAGTSAIHLQCCFSACMPLYAFRQQCCWYLTCIIWLHACCCWHPSSYVLPVLPVDIVFLCVLQEAHAAACVSTLATASPGLVALCLRPPAVMTTCTAAPATCLSVM